VRCPRCGGRVRAATGGMGTSDAPGCYFFTGLTFAGAAVAALVAAGLLWSWWWLPWACVGAGAAALLVWWSWVATDEVVSNRCQACGQECPPRPWSL
jgi:hypothetical protein